MDISDYPKTIHFFPMDEAPTILNTPCWDSHWQDSFLKDRRKACYEAIICREKTTAIIATHRAGEGTGNEMAKQWWNGRGIVFLSANVNGEVWQAKHAFNEKKSTFTSHSFPCKLSLSLSLLSLSLSLSLFLFSFSLFLSLAYYELEDPFETQCEK